MPTDVTDGRPAQRPGRLDEKANRGCPFAVDRKNPWKRKSTRTVILRPCCHTWNSKPYKSMLSTIYVMTDNDAL